jgi:hypothetical protein
VLEPVLQVILVKKLKHLPVNVLPTTPLLQPKHHGTSPARSRVTLPTPTIGGIPCANPPAGCNKDDYCKVQACKCPLPLACNPDPQSNSCIANCTSVCLNNKCYTTNVNPTNDVGCTSDIWTDWQCTSGVGACAACASQNYQCEYRFCANPPNSNQYQVNCGWTNCSSSSGGGGGSNPTNTPPPAQTNTPTPTNTLTPTPTNTLTPTPILPFIKLKNTSFYSGRSLNNPIPASPTAYDADDDGSANFIISSPGSDPGLVSATSIYLGQGQPSAPPDTVLPDAPQYHAVCLKSA